MDHSSNLSSAAAATIPALAAPQIRPTRGPPAGGGVASAGKRSGGSAEATQGLTEDHDRNAGQPLDDVVVQRLFAAGLNLQAAQGLVSDHLVADKIDRAIGELDQAISDLRDTIFDRGPRDNGEQPAL